MWIPTERATEGMKDTDKPRDKVFGFVREKKYSLMTSETASKRQLSRVRSSRKKRREGFVNGEDEMAMGTLY